MRVVQSCWPSRFAPWQLATYAALGLVARHFGPYFYLRVIQHLFMSAEDGAGALSTSGRYALGATLICLVGAILVGVFPGQVIGQF